MHYISSKMNRQQKQTQYPYQQYIYSQHQPASDTINDLPDEMEVELRNSIGDMRRQFRRAAKKIRDLYTGSI